MLINVTLIKKTCRIVIQCDNTNLSHEMTKIFIKALLSLFAEKQFLSLLLVFPFPFKVNWKFKSNVVEN